jgi:Transposase DDE domain
MARRDFNAVRDKFARDDGLPFGRLLTREYVLSVLVDEGHTYRNRIFCPLVTLWGWLSQTLSQDKSLNEAVSRILAHRVATGLPPISASSASYSDARTRFPESVMVRLAKEIGRKVHDSRSTGWDWRGRPILLADGTGLSMPDTPENQLEWPQSPSSLPGVGFPSVRAVALISLSTGAVLDFGFGKFAGKGTGELGLFHGIANSLTRGDIVLADRYYPTYSTIAMLNERGVDLISISHRARQVDFTKGEILGERDHIVEWDRPDSRNYDYQKRVALTQKTVKVREFVIEIEDRNGGTTEVVITTTLTDPTIPQKEISDLYWKRWNAEVDIRSIKHALHLDILRAKTPEMIRKEIWCHLLAWSLLRGIIVESAKQNELHPRELSVKGTMQAVESFTPAMMAIDGNEAIYHAMLSTISSHRVANRPGRQEPRLNKRRHARREFMMVPRHHYHRKLAREVHPLT